MEPNRIGIERATEPVNELGVHGICSKAIARWAVRGKRVLLIVPDNTRTAPIGLMFRILHELLAPDAAAVDVLFALGTHPPMSDEAIARRLGITPEQRRDKYGSTRMMNHAWDSPEQLVSIGRLSEDEIHALSGGRLREGVDVTINKTALQYDLLLIVGPTFPHEVVGFSGGNKYLVPGISGREIIDMFHWLGALITNRDIIGRMHTPVRAIVDRAAAMVPVERKCFSLVVHGSELVGLYSGEPEEAWEAAAAQSRQIHIRSTDHAYSSVLSRAPAMYEELWVGGKCAYKLEPVVADGGELIIFAPHISRISTTHGETIRQIGYHVRDYFLAQMARFAAVPRGILAHSTHVKGAGTFDGGVERPRIRVTLATGISKAECDAIHLGYRDPRDIDVTEWDERGESSRLYVPAAGETLFRLKGEPEPNRATSVSTPHRRAPDGVA